MQSRNTKSYLGLLSNPGARTEWIQRHELTGFFVLSFLITWSIVVSASAIGFTNTTAYSRMILVGAYGPALAAMIISKIKRPALREKSRLKWWFFFLPALALGTAIEWLDHTWWQHRIDLLLIALDAVLITLAAWTLTWLFSARNELSSGSSGRISWWKRLRWAFVALLVWPLLVILGNVIAPLLGWPVSAEPAWPSQPLPLILLESFAWYALFGGPLNEEPGWRGFALPRLQNRFSPMLASIILGAFWGFWHLPLHLLGIYGGGAFGSLIRFMDIPRAILFTWIYNRTQGSLLVAILFHAAVNTTSLFLPRSHYATFVLCFIAAGIVVLMDKMWKGPQSADAIEPGITSESYDSTAKPLC